MIELGCSPMAALKLERFQYVSCGGPKIRGVSIVVLAAAIPARRSRASS